MPSGHRSALGLRYRWATSHRDVAAPKGEPSRCAAESLQKAKSRLPPWGALVPSGHRSALDRAGRREWTRVSEDGEGKLPAAPSHGLCGSAGGLPSQSPNGDSSPKGGAKSRLPLWGRCHAFGMTERARRWLAPQLSGSRLLGAPPKACAKPSLASPFGGGAPVGGGEGSVKPPSRCATGREKRCAVSLASLWLTPTKVKVETFL